MTGAIGLPEDPEEAPIETEGVGEDPGSVPGDEPAVEPMDPVEPAVIEPDDAGKTAVSLQPTHEDSAAGEPK